jgi:hypothetical protein
MILPLPFQGLLEGLFLRQLPVAQPDSFALLGLGQE